MIDDIRVGFDEVRRSPLLRLVAIAYVLLAVLMFSVSFPFLVAAKAAFPVEADLSAALGLLAAGVTALSFVVSLAVANRFYTRLGVAAAALLLPLVYLGGFALWIVRFTFATATAVSVAQQVTQRGLSNAAWSAFYNVVPAARRAQALAFNDGVPGQLGIMLSGVLLLTAGRLLAPDQVFWLGLITAAACTAVVVAIRRRYGTALVLTLRSGVGEQVLEGGPGLGDLLRAPDVRAALVDAVGDADPSARELAASLLARSPTSDARIALAAALDDTHPGVRAAAIWAVLGGEGSIPDEARDRAAAELDRLLEGDEVERILGLRTLDRLGWDMLPERRVRALLDPSSGVRAMAMAVLGRATDPNATTTLVAALDDPSPLVRRAATIALSGRPDPTPAVVDLLTTGAPAAQEAAIGALVGHGAAVREPVLAWADRHVARALDLADARRSLSVVVSEPDETAGFLASALDRRVERHQDLALAAMMVLGAPAATGVIRRRLRAVDPDLRAQAIEALDSIGDRRLGGAIARLLDPPPPAGVVDDATIVGRLRDDEDPWIAGLARRILSSGEERAESMRSLGDIDTMLRLRRVPLFERLAPEDLQRIATVATERRFGRDEVLVHEGELGDEMFVILEGTVQVTRRQPDGTDRVLRTYTEGDHVGELAVLREAPRAGTVIAVAPGVRVLVLKGDGLTAILRERPDAAMAMLETLADRISAQ